MGIRRSGKIRTTNKQFHRVPILPFRLSPNGICRMCGSKVAGRRRTWCSDSCVLNWKIASNHHIRRQQVYLRDKGVCAKCNIRVEGWQVDHIKPLIECSRGNIDAFLMGNLRTLCAKHHSAETKILNRKRRKEKAVIGRAMSGAVKRVALKSPQAKIIRKKERRTKKELLRRMSLNSTSVSSYRKSYVKKIRRSV